MTRIERTKSINTQENLSQNTPQQAQTLWEQFSPHIDVNNRDIQFKAKVKATSSTKKVALNVINGHQPMNGIAAMIQALQPTLDETSAEIASFIIRGDLIAHVKNNPEKYQEQLKIHDLTDLREVEKRISQFSEKIALSKELFNLFEFEVLADVFKVPIELHYPDGAKVLVGHEYPKPIISLRCFEDGFTPIL